MRQTALNAVYELAKRDERVVFIGSDLGVGVLDNFKKEMPDRFYMEGISEQNIVGMAAGMAMEGKIPFINTIGTFLTRRCYEQVVLDAALHELPVRFISTGGGLVYAPLGPTHLAIDDISLMRVIPGMTVVAPADPQEMKEAILDSTPKGGPIFFRVAKGGEPVITEPFGRFQYGRVVVARPGDDAALVTTGVLLSRALEAHDALKAKGTHCRVVHVPTLKPLDPLQLATALRGVRCVVSAEEHSIIGGLGDLVTDAILAGGLNPTPRYRRLGIPDVFPDRYGTQDDLLRYYGLDAAALAIRVAETLELKGDGVGAPLGRPL